LYNVFCFAQTVMRHFRI